jgi:hypothetical protein
MLHDARPYCYVIAKNIFKALVFNDTCLILLNANSYANASLMVHLRIGKISANEGVF